MVLFIVLSFVFHYEITFILALLIYSFIYLSVFIFIRQEKLYKISFCQQLEHQRFKLPYFIINFQIYQEQRKFKKIIIIQIKNRYPVSKMFSTPAFIKCINCKSSPKQFTFLICNHILCGQCISKNIIKNHKYSMLNCSCGTTTYFNQKNQTLQDSQVNQIKSRKTQKPRKQRTSIDDQIYHKNGQSTPLNSKTIINERSTMPMLEVSSVFSLNKSQNQQNYYHKHFSPQKQRYFNGSLANQLKYRSGTQKTAYDQSLLLQNFQNGSGESYRNPQQNYINQFSTHCITENPKNIDSQQYKTQKYIKNNKQNSMRKSHSKATYKKPQSHSQFQNEIEFLGILFTKDMQEIQNHFKQIIDNFKQIYLKVQQQLRSLYVEQIISKDKFPSLNLADLIKKKYQNSLGSKFKQLKDQLYLIIYPQRRFQSNKFKQTLFETFKPQNSHEKFQSFSLQKSNSKQNDYSTQNFGRVSKFETVEQKLQRLTANKDRKIHVNNNNNGYVKYCYDDIGKRVQTQNIHTNIKKHKRHNIEQQNQRPTRYDLNDSYTQSFSRSIENAGKARKSQKYRQQQNEEDQNVRKNMIYYSPPLSYCYKHLQKRSKQAKNYISYIQKLCHDKKMKNNRQLFKKVKQLHPYQFKNRD